MAGKNVQTITEDEAFKFLDDLRERGSTNMFGAAPYLVRAFDLDMKDARETVAKWMETFSARHPKS